LDFDDRLGALQPLCQEPVVALAIEHVPPANGLGAATLGPRLTGLSASKAPAARWRRQSVNADE